MAVSVRRQTASLSGQAPLSEILRAEPYRFSFFQAVRLLARLHPERNMVGNDTAPAHEVARFRAHLSVDFPPSEIFDLKFHADDSHPPEVIVAFMGLTGPVGALPRFYTDQLLERARVKDRTLRDFLDQFNHRLISLFYRAWEKSRFWTGYERAELLGRERREHDQRQYRSFVVDTRKQYDLFSQCLLDLGGMGTPSLRYRESELDTLQGRTRIDDETLRYFAGLLAQQHRSAVALEGMLADYFGLAVDVLQFCGQWLYLEPENQTCLTDEGNALLGLNAVVGERFWDRQGKFRIRLGPLTYKQFRDFLPLGTAFIPLAQLARLFAGRQYDIDVQAVLLAAEVPWCQLSASPQQGAYLGWNTWIRNDNLAHDAEDAVFAIHD